MDEGTFPMEVGSVRLVLPISTPEETSMRIAIDMREILIQKTREAAAALGAEYGVRVSWEVRG